MKDDTRPDFQPLFMTMRNGSEYEATLGCVPDNEEGDWGGYIKFTNDMYNWPVSFTGEKVDMYEAWGYPRRVVSGTYMMNLLMGWHQEIVEFIERMKGK